jgi:LacI family transcriptional regulator
VSSTVARALNDGPQISEPTKVKVREAARELGYIVHSAARLMRGETSTVIGPTVPDPDIENEFYLTLARAVAEVCRESGFQLVLSVTEDEPAIEEHLHALVGAQAAAS